MSGLSRPKSQPCGSRSSMVSLLCRTTRRTQQSSTASSHKLTTNSGGGGGRNKQPPSTCPYDRFKGELIRYLSLSQEQLVHQLLMHEGMGDRRRLSSSATSGHNRPVSNVRFSPNFVDESPAAKYSGHNCHASAGCLRRCGPAGG